MHKQSIQYDSPLDALAAIAKRLSRYEREAGLSSEETMGAVSVGYDTRRSSDLATWRWVPFP